MPARLPASGDADVLIVGAGAAGLAAARTLLDRGLDVRVLEAAHRPGGRAFTESTTFGVPFDHGCSWITSADTNPHTEAARRGGFELIDYSHAADSLFVGNRRADALESRAYEAAYTAISAAIEKAAEAGRDVPAATVIPDTAFSATVQTWTGPLDMGVDYKDLSTVDYWNGAETAPLYRVRAGYGALVASLARGLPVRLGASVYRIDWSGPGVRVHSTRGSVRARACIVSVSTGVLASGGIVFRPALPDWKQRAIHDLPMGLLAKIVLQFEGTRFDLPEDAWLTYRVSGPMPADACFFVSWPAGLDLMEGFVGGEFGFELSRAGPDAAVDFALGELRKLLGSRVDRYFVKGAFTGWADNPLTLGAYAAARPGRAGARYEIGRSLSDRLFFAGEACAGAYAATCGGAAMNGRHVGERVASVLA